MIVLHNFEISDDHPYPKMAAEQLCIPLYFTQV